MSEEARKQIPDGLVLLDSNNTKWIVKRHVVGESVEYHAVFYSFRKSHGDVSFTSEISFYKEFTTSAKITRWMRTKEILCDDLGIPRYLGSAQNVLIQNIPSDFLVLERYGLDLQSLLSEHHNFFPKPTVLKIAYHILRVLEYFHQRGYVHGDIRACDIRTDLYDDRTVYLLPQFHRTDESDGNNLTSSRAHRKREAAIRMREDIESLLYNLIDWSGGILPWKNALPDEVKNMKIQAFENPKQFLQDAFPSCECEDPSECLAARKCAASGKLVAPYKCLQAIVELTEQVASMKKKKNNCKPCYKVIENILKRRLLNMYHVPASKLEFAIPTVIGDEGQERSTRSSRKSVNSNVPVGGIAIDVLATIIAENCSNFDEVDMFGKPGGVLDVVSQLKMNDELKMTINQDATKSVIQKAWEEDTQGLRTKVIDKWHLKGLEPGDYSDWKHNSTEKRAEKIMDKIVKLVDHDSSDHELSVEVEHGDERNRDVLPSRMPEQLNEKVDQRSPGDTVLEETSEEAEMTDEEQVIGPQKSTSVNDKQWHEEYDWLDGWLGFKELLLGSFGTISSKPQLTGKQVQQLRILREDYDKQELLDRLSHLENVLTGLPPDSADAQKINRVQQQWLSQLAWLEESSRKLDDASISQLHDVLQDSEILVWLVKELDGMPVNLTFSNDPAKFQQQREHYETVYQRVIDNEAKVVMLINEGHDVLTRSQNHSSSTVQQLFLDAVQYQWDRLKKSSLDIHNKLQNCDKYCQMLNLFVDWLKKTEDKLESLKPTSLNNIDEVLKELSSLTDETCEKAGEFAEMTKLGQIFLGVCDEDKHDQVKNEFNAVKERWAKLSTYLPKRKQSLESIVSLALSFHENLHTLIKLCEDKLLSYGAVEGPVDHPVLFGCTEASRFKVDVGFEVTTLQKVQAEILPLQMLLEMRHGEAKDLSSKTREEGIDTSHLLNLMNNVTIIVKYLNTKVFESTNKILKQQCGILIAELQQAKNYNRDILEIIEKREALKSNIKSRFSNITNLEKIVQIAKELGSPIDAEAIRPKIELLSQQIDRLEPYENRLKETLRTEKHSSNVNDLMQKSEERSSEEVGDASSSDDDNCSSHSSPNENNNEFQSNCRKRRRSQSQDSDTDPSRPSISNDNLQSDSGSTSDDSSSVSTTSSNSSKTQNTSDSDLSPSRPKKSKHSEDLDDYDSNLSLPKKNKNEQGTQSCHSNADHDYASHSPEDKVL